MSSQQRDTATTLRISSEISIFRGTSSSIWQCRFKLLNGQCHRLSTGSSDEAQAQLVAVKLAHQWAAREQLGLPIRRPTFGTIAREVRQELEQSLAAHHGKAVYQDYITVLDKYLIPFFGSQRFEDITPEQLSEFDRWRGIQKTRTLSISTMRTDAAAFNRVTDAARLRGLLPANRPSPTLSVSGEREIRPLLRDYVEFLLFTGVRHGTEARGLEWQHLQWHFDGGRRFLRI